MTGESGWSRELRITVRLLTKMQRNVHLGEKMNIAKIPDSDP